VLAYTHKIFMDVAINYDVDGLHMDYVRYPGPEWGYNPQAVALYMQQTGATTTPAPEDEAWKAWRRGRITAFVRDLHADLRLEKPHRDRSRWLHELSRGHSHADPPGARAECSRKSLARDRDLFIWIDVRLRERRLLQQRRCGRRPAAPALLRGHQQTPIAD